MFNDLRFVKNFLLLAMVIIALVIAVTFFGFYIRTEKLMEGVVLQQARALFKEIILTRRWVTEHGGVFVLVRPGVDPNPYLSKLPGLKVNIRDEEGKLYTLRNPGLVVREISELAGESGLFYFHVASLKPVNKQTNSPDAFETKALQLFEKGKKEYITIEDTKQGPVFRYMAPLYYESSCSRCHAHQGYKSGDIRGGISVTIPMSSVNQQLKTNRLYMIASALIVLGLLFGVLYFLSMRFIRALSHAQSQLVLMAATDSLTRLSNRRTGIVRLEEEISRHHRLQSPLSCLLLDIDHFKEINDTYGHLAGDAVLISVADILRQCVREYDIVCRYGGEEFMILLPETGLAAAITVAERMREKISENTVIFNDESIKVTASVGVTQMKYQGQETADSIIYHADCALYEAKAGGRNRVVSSEQPESGLGKPCA